MKLRVLLPSVGLMLMTILFVGGALAGSCDAYSDWSLSQAGHQAKGVALSASFSAGRLSRR